MPRLLAVVLCCATLACGTRSAVPDETVDHWYRARIRTSDGHDIPFFLHVPGECDRQSATIVNGDERITVACERRGRQVVLDFPVYGTRISAVLLNAGTLEGSWIREYLPADHQRMAFTAEPIDEPRPRQRFPATETSGRASPIDVSGIWRMHFDARGPAKGIFSQTAGVVSGTAEVPAEYGDLRYLAGLVDRQQLSLSSFDGQHAYLIEGRAQPDGTLKGSFVCCDEIRDSFVAERSDDFQVVDPLQEVRVVSADRHLDFDALRDPKYAGKAVIVELFGTWCPNCNDLAPVLGELYDAHQKDGLEVVAIAYELSEDPGYNEARLAAYRKRHQLRWDMIVADAEPADLFRKGAAQLSTIGGVPVTIFLNRDHTIHRIYAGFSGPATGGAYRSAVSRFRALTQEILASH